MEDFADNNFKFDENGGKFSEWVENAERKGEIACYKQFLLFPQNFSKDLYSRHERDNDILIVALSISF